MFANLENNHKADKKLELISKLSGATSDILECIDKIHPNSRKYRVMVAMIDKLAEAAIELKNGCK